MKITKVFEWGRGFGHHVRRRNKSNHQWAQVEPELVSIRRYFLDYFGNAQQNWKQREDPHQQNKRCGFGRKWKDKEDPMRRGHSAGGKSWQRRVSSTKASLIWSSWWWRTTERTGAVCRTASRSWLTFWRTASAETASLFSSRIFGLKKPICTKQFPLFVLRVECWWWVFFRNNRRCKTKSSKKWQSTRLHW